jgi:hypothetical protein
MTGNFFNILAQLDDACGTQIERATLCQVAAELVKAEALQSLARSLAKVADRMESGLDIEIQGKNPE